MECEPLVTCIMPTYNRRAFVPAAIHYFLRQDYPNKELIVVDDGSDPVGDLIPNEDRIRYIRLPERSTVGAKRNLACAQARGTVVAHWDDDDWHAVSRLSYQVRSLLERGAPLCGLSSLAFYDFRAQRAWLYTYPANQKPWLAGGTFCYHRSLWEQHRFADVDVGEDARFVWSLRGEQIAKLDDHSFYLATIHDRNISPKAVHTAWWRQLPVETLERQLGHEWLSYLNRRADSAHVPTKPKIRTVVGPESAECFGGDGGVPALAASGSAGTALISAASGIGDIIRVTPLIRVAYRLGYVVDVLLSPDEPAAVELLRGAPEIHRIIAYPNVLENRGALRIPELDGARYDLATFTTWSAPLAKWVDARRRHAFEQSEWLSGGDAASVEKIARALGWEGALPAPFAMKSARRFELPPDTIALHPGCKPNWPWKKWHGFDELAALFANVAIVGTAADLDNSRTYFDRPFAWPEHVRDFTGKLNLCDTAALISQCAALVSLDSGLMHLGVALGVPTFGIFGITSPERECIPSPFMVPITKELPCEPACRRDPWGRRDCERHLECLKMLTADEVAARVAASLPERAAPPRHGTVAASKAAITLNYYGEVFDASGYGEAARAYVRALHAAGVRVCVIDTGAKPAQVDDDVVASLVGHDAEPDFNLFHGIPSAWARSAYPLRNVIAMTVWETDRMPQIWRNPLSHAVDVWLPCAFNVEVFTRDLGRTPYRLPHALPVRAPADARHDQSIDARLGIEPEDFVFYSIFEWQDRKHPRGLIEAFLRAFPDASDAVLLIKTNERAASEAKRTLEELRAAAHSHGRVVLHCAAFDEALLRAVHARGDCYISLHKGEGWGYPLFEAACAGKPVVATAYAGPLDYLDPERHWLVRRELASVRQPYVFYHPSMKWAEPDLAHAREGLRWTYEHRAEARAAGAEAARHLAQAYSIEQVGAAAKARLTDLLKRTNPERYVSLVSHERERRAPAALPIAGEWYDADYFEYGLKSNWQRGYTWPHFEGLFQETAAFLHDVFPDAKTYLDAGCAKGFLVRALRERGLDARGFDHSPWAIAHAEASVKPFLELAATHTVEYGERCCDVLVAMSLLETLTEEQIRLFLPRARGWVRGALFATIPSTKSDDDRDLSHITLRERDWWRERFLEAGWRQDPLHRAFERLCQRHGVPAKMNWNVYVFAPGT